MYNPFSFGFWATFGAKGDLGARAGIDMAKRCLTVARDAGTYVRHTKSHT
jgi:hypothetical protein